MQCFLNAPFVLVHASSSFGIVIRPDKTVGLQWVQV